MSRQPVESNSGDIASTARDGPPWWSSGADPVVDGVTRIAMPMPDNGLKAINVYALESDDGVVLVDAGWSPLEGSRDRLVAGLADIGHRLEDVRMFLVTHLHRDHFTFAVEHRREFGSRIALGVGEKDSLRAFSQLSQRPHEIEFARLVRCGCDPVSLGIDVEPVDPSIWEEPDYWVSDGQTIPVGGRTLRVVATPGHSAGHVCLLDAANELLFSGDHVLPSITPSVGSEPSPVAHPLGDYLDSLKAMASLPDCLVLPAHGPVTTGLHRRAAELLAHHGERLERCREALDEQPRSAQSVASGLRWTRRQLELPALKPMDQMRALFETVQHLDLLADRSVVHRDILYGVAYFSQPPTVGLLASADVG